MTRRLALTLAVALTGLAALAGAQGREAAKASAAFRTGTIEGQHWEGPIEGPWEFSKGVKLTSGSLVLTCDRMKVWLTKDLRDLEKVEAGGSIVIKGRYLTGEQVKTEWDVLGKAQGASYDAKTGQSVLTGSVQFKATNLTTGAVVSAAGDKLVYDTKTRRFRFERGKDGVQVKWQDPRPGEDATSPPPESQSKKGETKE